MVGLYLTVTKCWECSAVSTEYRRVTDGQTSCNSIVRAMHTRRAITMTETYGVFFSISYIVRVFCGETSKSKSSLRQTATARQYERSLKIVFPLAFQQSWEQFFSRLETKCIACQTALPRRLCCHLHSNPSTISPLLDRPSSIYIVINILFILNCS